jgi:hypothetical protein
MAISKSIWGNLKSRLKNRGILISLRREDEGVEPKFEGPPVGRGRVMCGFILGMRRCAYASWWCWRQRLSCRVAAVGGYASSARDFEVVGVAEMFHVYAYEGTAPPRFDVRVNV